MKVEALFWQVLTMSVTGSLTAVVVLLARWLMRHGPKPFSCVFWGLVGFRLVCPVAFVGAFSLFALLPVGNRQVTDGPGAVMTQMAYGPVTGTTVPNEMDWITGLSVVWLAGIGVLLATVFICYYRTKTRLSTGVRVEKGLYECDCVRSPVVIGLFRPKIYIPFGLPGQQRDFALAHERSHIRRGDIWVKLLAFLTLSVHWFNPLLWLCYFLFIRDLEMSVDERVLQEAAPQQRKEYAQTLLSFGENRRLSSPAELTFGETSIKSRVENVLDEKKSRIRYRVLGCLLLTPLLFFCATNPILPADEVFTVPTVTTQEENKNEIKQERFSREEVQALEEKARKLAKENQGQQGEERRGDQQSAEEKLMEQLEKEELKQKTSG